MNYKSVRNSNGRGSWAVRLGLGSVLLMIAGAALAPASAEVHRGVVPPTNLDAAKAAVASYYGDYVDADGLHQASDTSAWGREVARVNAAAKTYLAQHRTVGKRNPAIVLDVDDTALSSYAFGANADFTFHNTTAAAQYAFQQKLTGIPATQALAQWAHDQGISVFFVTGRPEILRAAPLANLTKAGFPAPEGVFFAPDAAAVPDYLTCDTVCTTVQYKSGTRAHIESLGYDVIANVGDQTSDLLGGHADASFKLPNYLYVIP